MNGTCSCVKPVCKWGVDDVCSDVESFWMIKLCMYYSRNSIVVNVDL